MFLFVIGLEMQPSRLWSLRREIFGLGVAQVAVCGALLTGVGILFGFPPVVAFIAAMGFVLSSTAIVMQILEERGDTATPQGQRLVSILLLEDLAIVPLLALVAFLAPSAPQASAGARWLAIGIALAAIAALVAAGRWLLNPMFRVLADAQAREVMTAAALLVVLGAALVMQVSGLSMAMGAFLAGVLLSESTFRHQLETDIEPFRGILLGAVLPRRRHVARPRRDRAQLAADPRRRAGLHAGQVDRHLHRRAAVPARPPRGALSRRAAGAGRRVRLRALCRRGRRRPVRRRPRPRS